MSSERVGPNWVKPSDVYRTTDPAQPVKLKIAKEGLGAEEPISIPSLLKRAANNYPDHAAMKYKTPKKEYATVTYK